ncbi:hypothetical protein L596_024501 [Steinernema carpocapsae]|uniref:Uncharacterized protein n=1 Tax=Steinernema carpocapsae TaxID=34508 RepID=A0A4U5MH84_STECR|nr:hypothetical protein L596_024501 [Steinernema carpocapsae]
MQEFPVYSVFAILSLAIVLLLIGVVLRFASIRPSIQSKNEDFWKATHIVRGALPQINFPSISTIASLPNIPRIIVDNPPDYEEARASPCPSYEEAVCVDVKSTIGRSSINLLAVIP